MILNQSIQQELKRKTEESALTMQCQNCQTEGQFRVYVNELREVRTPTSPPRDRPDFVNALTCRVCGHVQTEPVRAEVTQ